MQNPRMRAAHPCAAFCCTLLNLVGVSSLSIVRHSPRVPILSLSNCCLRSPPVQALAVPSQLAPLAGIAVLTGVIVVHEFGHFAAARIQGIRVSVALL